LRVLENITIKDVEEFLGTLTPQELRFYDIYRDNLFKNAVYIKGVWREGELVGIGGVAKWCGILPHLFFMIKENCQSQGMGSEIADSCMEFAKRHHYKFFAGIASKENVRSIYIIKKRGYERMWEDEIYFYSIKLFERKWFFMKALIKPMFMLYSLLRRVS
jgi:RimJ/RimL family protein N-acetyltransferase